MSARKAILGRLRRKCGRTALLAGHSPAEMGLKAYLHDLRLAVLEEGGQVLMSDVVLEKRVKLRHSNLVLDGLELWWEAAMFSILHSRSPPGLARIATMPMLVPRSNQGLNESHYIEHCRRLYKALMPNWEEKEAQEAAQMDWRIDSNGDLLISKRAFQDSLFILADIWTIETNSVDYATFLRELFVQVTEPVVDPGQKRERNRWLPEEEISYGGWVMMGASQMDFEEGGSWPPSVAEDVEESSPIGAVPRPSSQQSSARYIDVTSFSSNSEVVRRSQTAPAQSIGSIGSLATAVVRMCRTGATASESAEGVAAATPAAVSNQDLRNNYEHIWDEGKSSPQKKLTSVCDGSRQRQLRQEQIELDEADGRRGTFLVGTARTKRCQYQLGDSRHTPLSDRRTTLQNEAGRDTCGMDVTSIRI